MQLISQAENGMAASKIISKADYVIAQGTETVSGVEWTYRKWNSGIYECWTTCYDSTSATSHRFTGSTPITFTATPCILASGCNVAETDGGVRYAKTDTTTYEVFVKGSWNHDAYVNIHLIGKWK